MREEKEMKGRKWGAGEDKRRQEEEVKINENK